MYRSIDPCGFVHITLVPFPPDFWAFPDEGPYPPWQIVRLSTYEGVTYLKLAVCSNCHDIVSAGKPTESAPDDINFHTCTCQAVKVGYDPTPDSNIIVVSGKATLLACVAEEWEKVIDPAFSDRRLFFTFMTVPRNASTVIDLDIDPSAPLEELATHYQVMTKAPVIILAHTDREFVIKYLKTGVQHTVSRLQFYQNYAEMA